MDVPETTRQRRITAQRNLPGCVLYQSEEAQELQRLHDLLENPSRELARTPGYNLFAEEIAQRLRSTMAKLEHPRRHQPRSRGGTTPSASSCLNNSPRADRRDNKSRPLLILTPVGEEFLERLMINKLPGEVIIHHSNLEICNSR